jgi:hypothetical protein
MGCVKMKAFHDLLSMLYEVNAGVFVDASVAGWRQKEILAAARAALSAPRDDALTDKQIIAIWEDSNGDFDGATTVSVAPQDLVWFARNVIRARPAAPLPEPVAQEAEFRRLLNAFARACAYADTDGRIAAGAAVESFFRASVAAAPLPGEWAARWHHALQTVCTVLGIDGNGSPEEILDEFAKWRDQQVAAPLPEPDGFCHEHDGRFYWRPASEGARAANEWATYSSEQIRASRNIKPLTGYMIADALAKSLDPVGNIMPVRFATAIAEAMKDAPAQPAQEEAKQ